MTYVQTKSHLAVFTHNAVNNILTVYPQPFHSSSTTTPHGDNFPPSPLSFHTPASPQTVNPSPPDPFPQESTQLAALHPFRRTALRSVMPPSSHSAVSNLNPGHLCTPQPSPSDLIFKLKTSYPTSIGPINFQGFQHFKTLHSPHSYQVLCPSQKVRNSPFVSPTLPPKKVHNTTFFRRPTSFSTLHSPPQQAPDISTCPTNYPRTY